MLTNDFVIPIFSATISSSSALLLKNSTGIWIVLLIGLLFITVYFASILFVKMVTIFWDYLKPRIPCRKKSANNQDSEILADHFNIDVFNQILLSYTLLKESSEPNIDTKLKKYDALYPPH